MSFWDDLIKKVNKVIVPPTKQGPIYPTPTGAPINTPFLPKKEPVKYSYNPIPAINTLSNKLAKGELQFLAGGIPAMGKDKPVPTGPFEAIKQRVKELPKYLASTVDTPEKRINMVFGSIGESGEIKNLINSKLGLQNFLKFSAKNEAPLIRTALIDAKVPTPLADDLAKKLGPTKTFEEAKSVLENYQIPGLTPKASPLDEAFAVKEREMANRGAIARTPEQYPNVNNPIIPSKIPLTGKETPQELMIKAEEYAKQKHPDINKKVLYHGTTDINASKIKSEGFKPSVQEKNVWGDTITSGASLTDDLATAQEFANAKAQRYGGKPQVIQLDITDVKNPEITKYGNAKEYYIPIEELKNIKIPKEQIQAQIDYLKELANEHPGKELQRSISKKEGQIEDLPNPDVLNSDGKFKYSKSKREAIRKSNAIKMTRYQNIMSDTKWSDSFDNVDARREVVDEYKGIIEQIKNLEEQKKTAPKQLKYDYSGKPIKQTSKENELIGTKVPFLPNIPQNLDELPIQGQTSNLPPLSSTPPKIKIPKIKVNEPEAPSGPIGLIKRELAPLKYVSPETADVFRKWNSDLIKGKELSNQISQTVDIPGDSMDLINRYQNGENVPEIKKIFDTLYNEANKRGLEIPYRENYIPQVYKENYPKIQKAITKYLTDHGVTDEQALDYIKGVNNLPEDVAKRLKLSPSFEKERVFANYKVAEEYGLHPKYTTIKELAAHYKGELEKTMANNKLLENLKAKGLLKPADSEFTPKNWKIVNPEFSNKLYKAPANVANVINNLFPSEKTVLGSIVKPIGEISGMAQNISLSGGFPGTNINFFTIGQLNKELHGGNIKSIQSFLKSNSKSATVKYFNENRKFLLNMADQNIDVTLRMGSFGQESMKELFKDREFIKAVGFGIDKAFGEKTFQGLMPMMQVELFKDVYKSAIKKGLSEIEANKLAGDIVKKNFGINSDDFTRSQTTKDTLKALFFAPRFRETVIKSLFNTGKAGTDFIYHLGGLRGKVDPSLSRNRRLLLGMIISFGLYNIINKKLNGNYMWDNPTNRKFALRIPLENGDVTYVEFMPSYLAFARNMASGAIALGTGEFKTATQQFGQVFSMPVKLASDVIGNSDYFGSPIYKDTDSGSIKTLKISKYLGLSINHPYVKELVNQIEQKKPLYQSIITGMELPLKFSSVSKEETNKIFDYKDKQDKERADVITQAQKEYNRIQKLPKEQAQIEAQKIKQNNPEVAKKMYDILEADKMGLTPNEKYIKMLGVKYRAMYIYDKAEEMKTNEERNAWINDLIKKKVVTQETLNALDQYKAYKNKNK